MPPRNPADRHFCEDPLNSRDLFFQVAGSVSTNYDRFIMSFRAPSYVIHRFILNFGSSSVQMGGFHQIWRSYACPWELFCSRRSSDEAWLLDFNFLHHRLRVAFLTKKNILCLVTPNMLHSAGSNIRPASFVFSARRLKPG